MKPDKDKGLVEGIEKDILEIVSRKLNEGLHEEVDTEEILRQQAKGIVYYIKSEGYVKLCDVEIDWEKLTLLAIFLRYSDYAGQELENLARERIEKSKDKLVRVKEQENKFDKSKEIRVNVAVSEEADLSIPNWKDISTDVK